MNVAGRDSVPTISHAPDGGDPSIAAALRYGRIHDALGHQIHTVLAMLYLALLPLTTAPKDFPFGLLAIWTLIRLPHIGRSYAGLWRKPMVIALLAWVGWIALSMLWSPDPKQGFDELGAFRMMTTPLLLWPILDRLPWLIAAALFGVFAHNIIQILQVTSILALDPGEEDRIRGLIHPGKGGAWCAAAVLWHLFAVISGRGFIRWLSLALMLLAAAGLIASGSRGAWISAIAAIPLALLFTFIRRPSSRPITGVLSVIGVLMAVGVWTLASERLEPRINAAVQEVQDARDDGMYWTSSGLRIALWGWAWQVFRDHPVAGTGAGGFATIYPTLGSFQQACESTRRLSREEISGSRSASPTPNDLARAQRISERRIEYMRRDHAHSTYLHTLAQQGLVGILLLACALLTILILSWRDRFDHIYAGAALFVLVSWIVGAQFDCYELNGNQLGLLALVVASVMPDRAAVRLRWKASDSGEVKE
jgi:O-antigen ligase